MFSLPAAVQCLPLRGRLCSRWPTLHECKCWSLPFPPPALAKQEQLLLGKKKKKFLEFQAPWNYFVRQELSSEALRFRREVECVLQQFGALFWRVVALERSACVLRLPRPGPFVRNFCGIVLCCCSETRQLNTAKRVIVLLSPNTFLFQQIMLR